MLPLQLIGRSSSHYTRVTIMFAYELDVPFEFVPIYDLTQIGPDVYGGNPALKLPILRIADTVLFGTRNICRALAERAAARRIVWPETLNDALSRNAQELLDHCMSAQVQLIIGHMVSKLPTDNVYFAKARAGYEGALHWLDQHVDSVLREFPERDLSYFEIALYCLIEHLRFRNTVPHAHYLSLARFAESFATRPSAKRTPYRIDNPIN
jgi:glutathione S-transferase